MAHDETVGDLDSVGPGLSTDTPPGRPKRRVTPSVITLEVGDTRQLKNKSTSPVPVADDPESMFLETLAAFLGARHAIEVTHNAQMAGDENVGNVSGGHLHLHPQTQKMHVPIFCREKLRLNALFDQVARQGGYHVVCRHKLWHRVCVELGFDLTGQTSASYAMRRNYEKCGLFLWEMCDGDAAKTTAQVETQSSAKRLAADQSATQKGIKPWAGNVSGSRDPGTQRNRTGDDRDGRNGTYRENIQETPLETQSRRHVRYLKRNLPSAFDALQTGHGKKPQYNVTDAEEAATAKGLNLLPSVDITSDSVERAFIFPGANPHDYATVRNHILCRFRQDPNFFLSVEHAGTWFRSKHRNLVHCAHRFLTTAGFINFGVGFTTSYLNDTTRSGWGATKGTVVVIGAGLAGLQCARQLLAFGHRVLVVEARDRPGGRVWSKQLTGRCPDTGKVVTSVAEMGGSIITGNRGNPLSVIAKQLALETRPIRDTCPMYLERNSGAEADRSVDDKVFEAYNGIGGALEGVNELRGVVGDAANRMTLGETLGKVRREKNVICKHGTENDLWHWHLANLEFANATRLDTLSLGQWDQDDPFEFGGDHEWLPRGNGRLVAALARDVDIFYNTAVDTVEYGGFPGDGETSDVTGKQSHESQSETKSFTNATKSVNDDGVSVLTTDGRVFVADAVVVTVPLGVLKRGDLRFVPELPVRKKTAIENLGFGALNKVLLLFPTTFWDTRHDTFGWVNSCDNGSEHRGRFFMFYSYHGAELSGGSTLIALIAGDAALSMETSETDSEIVAGVMTVLRQIFARQGKGVPSPVDSTVTRWGTDPYARGSYSNISPRGTGEDYDALAAPVANKVFFAGEATSRSHPATMHGAFLSGNREAARIHGILKSKARKREMDGRVFSRGTGKDAW
eukprot:CAMPEP_0119211372 /NCGR_PEP_ID=MMETSP1327-20130426/2906_1 /TAXON_ID=38833 /ORGANISM="Micromonas pusilla, Strain RCC2306" /LENGTH=908 /DNA_ID=CAMNT_0007208499 /DNA_START=113 /DNA_END=2836 /DNA_ORIENTATION=-